MTSFLTTYDAAPDAEKSAVLYGALKATPLAVFADLRVNRPILDVPAGGPVLVTLWDDVTETLTQNTVFTVRPYFPKIEPSVGPFMLDHDNTVYNQRDKGILRALIQQADMPKVRGMVQSLAATAIAEGASSDGRLELISQVTRPVPVRLTGEYFGFPGPDLATMKRWSYWTQYDMFHNLTDDKAIHAKNIQSGQEMKAWLQAWLPVRRKDIEADPKLDDIVVRLLKSVFPEVIGFDESRILTNTMGFLVGAVETTSAAVAQAIDVLLDRPEQLAAAIAAAKTSDTSAFDPYFWEALRFRPMNPFVGRLCEAEYTIAYGTDRATTVQPGRFVLASNASAMHDASHLPDPEVFKTDRPLYDYMHFGYGPHLCLGDQVSWQQAPELARQTFRAGFTKRADGKAGKLDFQGGPFPESFTLVRA